MTHSITNDFDNLLISIVIRNHQNDNYHAWTKRSTMHIKEKLEHSCEPLPPSQHVQYGSSSYISMLDRTPRRLNWLALTPTRLPYK